MTALSPRQITLLRDVRRMGFMAFFDSRCRSEGPGLREMGMIGGIGDSTGLTEAGLAAVLEADAQITRPNAATQSSGAA